MALIQIFISGTMGMVSILMGDIVDFVKSTKHGLQWGIGRTMRFNKIEISNFLSYGENQEIELDRQGLVGIFGNNVDSAFDSNGSGKSSILEAIVWCLWGETVRGLKGDEVVNTKSGCDCEVVLNLEEGNKSYRIIRYRGKKGVKKNNDLILTIDGVDATAAAQHLTTG